MAGGLVTGATGAIVSDTIDISAGRKGFFFPLHKTFESCFNLVHDTKRSSDQTDFGSGIGVSMITGSTGGLISVAGDAGSKLTHGIAGLLRQDSILTGDRTTRPQECTSGSPGNNFGQN